MAIAFGTAGAAASGTTSMSVPHPLSIAANNFLLLAVSFKYNDGFTTPAGGWIKYPIVAPGGSGPNGIDTGNVSILFFYKIAVGGETGNLTVTNAGGNAMIGRMFRYTYDTTKDIQLLTANGVNSVPSISWSIINSDFWFDVGGNFITGSVAANDMMIATSAINADTYTYSAQAITISGVTFGATVERQDSGTTSGQDCHLVVTEHPVTVGVNSTQSATYVMTSTGSATNAPAGTTTLIRLREVNKPVGDSFDPFGMMGFFGL